jgi:CrcB protein
MITKLLFIALGGSIGAVLRYGLAGLAQRLANGTAVEGFPVGTLAVNLFGCLLIGGLGAYFAGPHLVREEHRAFLLVGLLGAFTTFSTFGWETFELANDRQLGLAGLNILLSNALGLLGVWIGYRLVEHVTAASGTG